MARSSSDRATLEKELANLLDYEDATDEIPDILENLFVSFFPDEENNKMGNKNPNDTSKDDLLEHMMAWLGNGGDRVRSFVDNIVRFKAGESVRERTIIGIQDSEERTGKTSNSSSNSSSNTQQSAGQGNAVRSKRQKQQDRNDQKQKDARQKKENLRKSQQIQKQRDEERQRQQQRLQEEESRKQKQEREQEREEQIITQKQKQKQKQKQREMELEELALANRRELQKKKDSTPPPPQTGQATIVCGCFGTKCKPLTNCLHCGRIACKKEGYGYCPFCSHLIQDIALQQLLHNDVAAPGSSMQKAILHKERLLQFDRDCAKRTIVLDDQADYFKNSSSTWLSGDERQHASEQDDRQRKELHERKKPVMKLDILG